MVPSIFDTSPGQRFRMEQWAPRLAGEGISVEFLPFENEDLHAVLYRQGALVRKGWGLGKALLRRLTRLLHLPYYDAVYLLREAALIGPAIFERWLRAKGVPLVYDFDDAVFVRYKSPTNGYLSYLKCPGKTATICKIAQHVMVNNNYLEEYARLHSRIVHQVPTTIETDDYRVIPRAPNDVPIVGWTGSHSTASYVKVLAPVLRDLARTYRFELKMVGAPGFTLPGVNVKAIPWNARTEVSDLQDIDIGIKPLPDDPWSRGKGAMKELQYMALGIPAIASPIGGAAEAISDDRNGFLAGDANEWATKLRALLESTSLRQRLGMAGRKAVESWYSAKVQAPRVGHILRACVDGAKNNSLTARSMEKK